jgi:hypothetical protein
VRLEASTKPHVHQKFEIFWTNIASTMACPNFKNGPKIGLRPLGVKGASVTAGRDLVGQLGELACDMDGSRAGTSRKLSKLIRAGSWETESLFLKTRLVLFGDFPEFGYICLFRGEFFVFEGDGCLEG